MGNLFSRELAADDLSLNMYRTLAILREKGELRLSDLAAHTGVELSTLSRMVGTLKQRGLVIRQRPEDNARTVAITLTPQGQALVERYLPKALSYEKEALNGFTRQEKQKIKSELIKINKNLDVTEKKLNATKKNLEKR